MTSFKSLDILERRLPSNLLDKLVERYLHCLLLSRLSTIHEEFGEFYRTDCSKDEEFADALQEFACEFAGVIEEFPYNKLKDFIVFILLLNKRKNHSNNILCNKKMKINSSSFLNTTTTSLKNLSFDALEKTLPSDLLAELLERRLHSLLLSRIPTVNELLDDIDCSKDESTLPNFNSSFQEFIKELPYDKVEFFLVYILFFNKLNNDSNNALNDE